MILKWRPRLIEVYLENIFYYQMVWMWIRIFFFFFCRFIIAWNIYFILGLSIRDMYVYACIYLYSFVNWNIFEIDICVNCKVDVVEDQDDEIEKKREKYTEERWSCSLLQYVSVNRILHVEKRRLHHVKKNQFGSRLI